VLLSGLLCSLVFYTSPPDILTLYPLLQILKPAADKRKFFPYGSGGQNRPVTPPKNNSKKKKN